MRWWQHLSRLIHRICWGRQRLTARQLFPTLRISKMCGKGCFQKKRKRKWAFTFSKSWSWASDPRLSRNWWRISQSHSSKKSVVLLRGKQKAWVSITTSVCSQTWQPAKWRSIGLKLSWHRSKPVLRKPRQQSVLASGSKSLSKIWR